jgi:hypothetical protein
MVSEPAPDLIALQELEPGENLLWTGRPDPGRAAVQILPLEVFGAVWTAILGYWGWAAWARGAAIDPRGPDLCFPLFGLPFLLIGLAALSVPAWVYLTSRRIVYAVSNERVLVVSSGTTRVVRTLRARDIDAIQRRERPDGSGNLRLACRAAGGSAAPPRTASVTIVAIPDVRSVEHIVRSAFQH